jgi:1,4-alpha-glucan branching enzyme
VLGLPLPGRWREILNTDAAVYGGSNRGNIGGIVARESESHGYAYSATMALPPLATLWLVYEGGAT